MNRLCAWCVCDVYLYLTNIMSYIMYLIVFVAKLRVHRISVKMCLVHLLVNCDFVSRAPYNVNNFFRKIEVQQQFF